MSFQNERIELYNKNGIDLLDDIKNNTIDLILTDPPYIISKESGMNKHYNTIIENEKNNKEYVKTEEQWEKYKKEKNIENNDKKNLFLKYGTIYGKKYGVKTDYGVWDNDFSIDQLDNFIKHYYRVLKKGGTLIIFFDLWKITILKEILEKYKFKQIRFIEWIKTNPQPRNSKVNYLTNCREIALTCVKGGKPTFHSKYDNGIYMYPFPSGKKRFHPTQKSMDLFKELIEKHSNENDVILDTFLGSGTTMFSCLETKRQFIGCELNKEYFEKIMHNLQNNYLDKE